jgi:thiol-disulfide isomerase/thioredoxin
MTHTHVSRELPQRWLRLPVPPRRKRVTRPGGSASGSGLPDLGPAPELFGVHPWLNTARGEPLTVAGLHGRILLLEFWTFACGNCQRTLPFLRKMHGRYRPGLAVIGIHTPEFPFERPARNVERAARARALTFPIGLDNDYATWDAYANRYWPSQYLIDGEGRIRYARVGEGAYGRTERAIRALLDEAGYGSRPAETGVR